MLKKKFCRHMQFFSNVHNHKHSPPAHTSYIWHLSNTPHFHKFVYSVHTLHWVVCFLLSNGELALQTAVVNKLILNKCVWQKVPPPPREGHEWVPLSKYEHDFLFAVTQLFTKLIYPCKPIFCLNISPSAVVWTLSWTYN